MADTAVKMGEKLPWQRIVEKYLKWGNGMERVKVDEPEKHGPAKAV